MTKFLSGFTLERLAIALGLGALFYACYIFLITLGQPLFEIHSSRQTQTALTSFWFVKEGFQLNYQTPGWGYPWSVPMEFPIYQAVVAAIVKLTTLPIEPTGRTLAFGLFLACLWPIWRMNRLLDLPALTFWFFVAIFFSAPVVLVNGRLFLIESTSLFLSLSGLVHFLQASKVEELSKAYKFQISLAILFFSLAALQKITTVLPILMALSIFCTWRARKAGRHLLRKRNVRIVVFYALPILVPLIGGSWWVGYSDLIKMQHHFGQGLTSTSLREWNWGTLEHRTTPPLYKGTIWTGVIKHCLGGWVGIIAIMLGCLAPGSKKVKIVLFTSLALGFVPFLLFPKLHMVHDYYQLANYGFIAFAVALAAGTCLQPRIGNSAALAMVMLVVGLNLLNFSKDRLPQIHRPLGPQSDLEILVGDWLRERLPPDAGFILLEEGYNPATAYVAQRKGFILDPKSSLWIDQVQPEPGPFVGGDQQLKAIVACKGPLNNEANLANYVQSIGWSESKLYSVGSCWATWR